MAHEDECLILASGFDPIADLRMAVEQIKREPKPQPDMVPWDEYMKNRATEMVLQERTMCQIGQRMRSHFRMDRDER